MRQLIALFLVVLMFTGFSAAQGDGANQNPEADNETNGLDNESINDTVNNFNDSNDADSVTDEGGTIELYEGWNMISSTETLNIRDIQEHCEIGGSGEHLSWIYEDESWLHDEEVPAVRGTFVYATESCTLNEDGSPVEDQETSSSGDSSFDGDNNLDAWNEDGENHLWMKGGYAEVMGEPIVSADYRLEGYGVAEPDEYADLQKEDKIDTNGDQFVISGTLAGHVDEFVITGGIETVEADTDNISAELNGEPIDLNDLEGVGSWNAENTDNSEDGSEEGSTGNSEDNGSNTEDISSDSENMPEAENDACKLIHGNGPKSEKYDLMFVAKDYNSISAFEEHVEFFLNYEGGGSEHGLFEIEPMASNKEAFNIWYMDAADSISNPDGLNADPIVLDARDAFAECPFSDMNIVFDTTEWTELESFATGEGNIFMEAVDQKAGTSAASAAFLHEWGHAFGDLQDEYYYETESEFRRAYGNTNDWDNSGRPNCASSMQEARDWWGDLAENNDDVDFYEGCSYHPDNIKPHEDETTMMDRLVLDGTGEEVSPTWSWTYGPVNQRAMENAMQEAIS